MGLRFFLKLDASCCSLCRLLLLLLEYLGLLRRLDLLLWLAAESDHIDLQVVDG